MDTLIYVYDCFVCTAPPLKLIDLPGLDQRIIDDKLVSFGMFYLDFETCFPLSCLKKQANQIKFLILVPVFNNQNVKKK